MGARAHGRMGAWAWVAGISDGIGPKKMEPGCASPRFNRSSVYPLRIQPKTHFGLYYRPNGTNHVAYTIDLMVPLMSAIL